MVWPVVALWVAPALRSAGLLTPLLWQANPVAIVERVSVPLVLETTAMGTVLRLLLAAPLAMALYDTLSDRTAISAFGLSVQVMGTGLGLMAGDAMLVLLLLQVADLGRWIALRTVPWWEIVGSILLVAGGLQLGLASGSFSWSGVLPEGLHPAWGLCLALGAGLRLGLFPAMSSLERSSSDLRPSGSFREMAGMGLLYFFIARVLEVGAIWPFRLLAPWAVITVLLALLRAAVAGPGNGITHWIASVLLKCGLAFSLSTAPMSTEVHILLAVVAALYVSMGLVGHSGFAGWGCVSSGCIIGLASMSLSQIWPLSAAGAIGFVGLGLYGLALSLGEVQPLSLVLVSLAWLSLAALAYLGWITGLLGGQLASAVVLGLVGFGIVLSLGVAMSLAKAARCTVPGDLTDRTELSIVAKGRLKAMVGHLTDGHLTALQARASLERLSALLERSTDYLGDRMAVAWLVMVALITLVILMR